MKIAELKQNDIVLFKMYDNILKRETLFDGNIISVDRENKTVSISYLYGYKSIIDTFKYDKVLYYPNKEKGKYMKLDGFSGLFIKLKEK